MATVPVGSTSPKMFCGECGGAYPADELARFGNNYVCVNCRPGYLQRIQQGAQPTHAAISGVQFGGFWIRALALLIDAIIVGIVTVPLILLVAFSTGAMRNLDPENPPFALFGVGYLVVLAITFAYHTWFVSEKGGTPGKLALGLRVVTPDGKNLTFAHATGRYFAQLLNGFTLYIGYLIAAFDSEKRALHDYICNTRVIRR